MFSAIAPTYDLLNRLLSFGVDRRWRRTLVEHLPAGPVQVLDLACGTGDVALEIARARPQARIAGADFTLGMLRGAQAKIAGTGWGGRITLQNAAAEDLPYRDRTFDAVTLAFGIRNVVGRERALAEMLRVLRPGGQVLLLDFSVPPHPVVRILYDLYFRRLLPLIGGLISGHRDAYRYLPASVAAFPPRGEFAAMMETQGFSKVTHRDLTLGVATLYRGWRGRGAAGALPRVG
ncbi:MAG: bifunctional demethylmenaquinone methyltransferase/2-methoxy-6-polyprenyl-1,4-benzoquinol methylase UbiE [Deltaproteobacteria bacterium]|nr:bifunctional demethylmenaquinone methyltransferase/2-methoxy-6-polyprenyl-1,4-benzoquinol methylase UbiE [Deltaproteobacteria bacterium]